MFGDERPQLTAGSQLGNQVIANMLHNINLAFGIIIVGDFRYGFFHQQHKQLNDFQFQISMIAVRDAFV